MSSKVTFISAKPKEMRPTATLPVLLDKMLKRWDFNKRFKDKRVAIKMHLGGNVGYSTIHPIFVRKIVELVKKAGGHPFITDVPGATFFCSARGYTEEVLGAKILPATGIADKYAYTHKLSYRTLKFINVAGNIADADAMIVLSHGKGHGNSSFGGAIKNVAMGCVDAPTRNQIHRLMSGTFEWDSEKCTRCFLCKDNCPNNAITYRDDKIRINDHACKYCMHCVNVCPTGAITIDQRGYRYFQHGMALASREVLKTFDEDTILYITVLLHITPFCDCWGMTSPAIVPDIGIIASDNIVAIDKAAIDMIKADNFIEGSLAYPLSRTGSGHLLKQIHGKDPYIQIEECVKVKLGECDYNLREVK